MKTTIKGRITGWAHDSRTPRGCYIEIMPVAPGLGCAAFKIPPAPELVEAFRKGHIHVDITVEANAPKVETCQCCGVLQ